MDQNTKTLFHIVWSTHEQHLFNFIKTKIEDITTAEDILQEVSIKFLNNLERETVIKNYKTWLFQVCRNTIADYYRKLKNNDQLNSYEHSLEFNTTGNCVCDLSEFVIKTYLPEKYSKPLFLSDIQLKPQKEIASMLNISLSATK